MACKSSSLLLSLLVSLATLASASGPLPIISPRSPSISGKVCNLTPLGAGQDDVPQILAAFESCNDGGTVVFPENTTFHIATRLNPVLRDVTIDWRGTWLFSDDLDYWRNNSYPIAFQNHHAGFVISGERIRLNGYGTGKINGSGNSWYDAEEGDTQPGRPMPFVWWNVSDVMVEHCTWTSLEPWLCCYFPLRSWTAADQRCLVSSCCRSESAVEHQHHEWNGHVV